MVRINNKTAKKYKSLLDLYLKDADLLNYNKTFIDLFDQRTNKKQLISKETVRSCLSAIIWKLKQSNGNAKSIKEYQLFMNPFIFMKGKKINKTLYQLFKKSKWSKK